MIGVGLEELGVEEFVEGKFFDGELYIDLKKDCYKGLGYKRFNFFGGIGKIFGKKGRDAISEAKKSNISGNMKGDGFQNGGTIIIKGGGKEILLNYVQEHPADHVPLDDVLKALGVAPQAAEASAGATTVTCDAEACSMNKS